MNSNRRLNEARPVAKTHTDYIAFGLAIEGEHPAKRKNLEDILGQKTLPSFHRLSGYYNVVQNTLNDFMHLFYNIILLIFEFIIRRHFTETQKNTFEAEGRTVPEARGGRNASTVIYTNVKEYYQKRPAKPGKSNEGYKKTRPPWQASNESMRTLMKRAPYRRVPGKTSGNIDQPIAFDKEGKPSLCIKGSADWIHMIGPIGIYYIYQLDVHPRYQAAFSSLLWWMFKLRRRYIIKSELDDRMPDSLPRVGAEVLAELEFLMPTGFCTILLHLLQHACDVLSFTGPPHATWMFVYERWNQIAKGLLHSPFSAAEGLMRAVMTHEWLTFSQYKTKQDLEALLTPPLDRHENYPVCRFLGNNESLNARMICDTHIFTCTAFVVFCRQASANCSRAKASC